MPRFQLARESVESGRPCVEETGAAAAAGGSGEKARARAEAGFRGEPDSSKSSTSLEYCGEECRRWNPLETGGRLEEIGAGELSGKTVRRLGDGEGAEVNPCWNEPDALGEGMVREPDEDKTRPGELPSRGRPEGGAWRRLGVYAGGGAAADEAAGGNIGAKATGCGEPPEAIGGTDTDRPSLRFQWFEEGLSWPAGVPEPERLGGCCGWEATPTAHGGDGAHELVGEMDHDCEEAPFDADCWLPEGEPDGRPCEPRDKGSRLRGAAIFCGLSGCGCQAPLNESDSSTLRTSFQTWLTTWPRSLAQKRTSERQAVSLLVRFSGSFSSFSFFPR